MIFDASAQILELGILSAHQTPKQLHGLENDVGASAGKCAAYFMSEILISGVTHRRSAVVLHTHGTLVQ